MAKSYLINIQTDIINGKVLSHKHSDKKNNSMYNKKKHLLNT